ncbi:hypothetical protein ACWDZ6_26475, partial [Streptomyces sp. NPDC002926]
MQFDNAEHYRSMSTLVTALENSATEKHITDARRHDAVRLVGRPGPSAAARLLWLRAPSTGRRKADSRRIPGSTSMASLPTPSADSRTRIDALREALATRVVVADGAMGTMLQAQDPTLEDFENLEGCNEVLNVTRP